MKILSTFLDHVKNVGGSQPLIGIMRTNLIASTTLTDISIGVLESDLIGQSNCNLFLNSDFGFAIVLPSSPEIAYGLDVTGKFMINLKLNFFHQNMIRFLQMILSHPHPWLTSSLVLYSGTLSLYDLILCHNNISVLS